MAEIPMSKHVLTNEEFSDLTKTIAKTVAGLIRGKRVHCILYTFSLDSDSCVNYQDVVGTFSHDATSMTQALQDAAFCVLLGERGRVDDGSLH